MYAVLDMDGNVVSQDGNEDGWVSPSGSPRTVELAGLEPNVSYIIVAKQADNGDAPSDRMINGSQVMVTGTSQQDRVYLPFGERRLCGISDKKRGSAGCGRACR